MLPLDNIKLSSRIIVAEKTGSLNGLIFLVFNNLALHRDVVVSLVNYKLAEFSLEDFDQSFVGKLYGIGDYDKIMYVSVLVVVASHYLFVRTWLYILQDVFNKS